MTRTVTLLTDFGLADEFVGVLEGVIARIAPDARVIHVSHGIAPQDVLQGATVLANALPYLPVGVHVAVVDPGVGSERRAVVVACADGRLLVGPDNGLLLPAAERVGGIAQAWAIADAALFLQPVSATFHGRDVFVPVAARLALGLPPEDVGPEIEQASLVRPAIAPPVVDGGVLSATIVAIDRFGNAALAAGGSHLDAAGIGVGDRLEAICGDARVYVVRARTFAEVRRGDLVAFEDSAGSIGLAMNHGSFADVVGARAGDRVALRPA